MGGGGEEVEAGDRSSHRPVELGLVRGGEPCIEPGAESSPLPGAVRGREVGAGLVLRNPSAEHLRTDSRALEHVQDAPGAVGVESAGKRQRGRGGSAERVEVVPQERRPGSPRREAGAGGQGALGGGHGAEVGLQEEYVGAAVGEVVAAVRSLGVAVVERRASA